MENIYSKIIHNFISVSISKIKYLLPYNVFKWVSIGNYQNFSRIKLPSVSIPVGKGNYEIWSIPLLAVTLVLWAGVIGIIVKKYSDYFQYEADK